MNNIEKAEAIKNWRFRWLAMIFEFAHLKYQRDLWIEHTYPDAVGWFGEDVCQYFDDLFLDDNYQLQLKEGVITHEEFIAIKDFHVAFDQYLETDKEEKMLKTDSEIIVDPSWISVVGLAAIAWQQLKNIIKDSEEITLMDGLEKNYLT